MPTAQTTNASLESLDAQLQTLLKPAQAVEAEAAQAAQAAQAYLQETLNLEEAEAALVIAKMQAGETFLEGLIAASPDAARFLLARQARQGAAQYSSPLEWDGIASLLQMKRLRGCVIQFLFFLLVLVFTVPAASLLLTQQKALDRWLEKNNPFAYARVLTSIEGNTPGLARLEDPRTIALDTQGYVYVADHDDNRIFRFDQQGSLLTRWTLELDSSLAENAIKSMTVDGVGRVYVVTDSLLISYDGQSGKEIERTSIKEPGKATLMQFNDIHLTQEGALAVVYGGENIALLDSDHKPLLAVAAGISSLTQEVELDAHITDDASGSLYLLGAINNTVVKYSPDGRFLQRFGDEGTGAGQFRSALALAIAPDGRIFVSDFIGVSIFTPEGKFINQFEIPAGVAYSMAFDADGHLWVISSENRILELKIK